MTLEQEQKLRMTLNQKKIQVGLIQPQQILQGNVELMKTSQEDIKSWK